MIRALDPSDLTLLKKIHEEQYADEFSFPDFENKFLLAFAHEHEGEIISAGGVRTICEVILITDKRQPVAIRREALYNMLGASVYAAKINKYDAIHAFVQEQGWKSHLMKNGFEPIKGDGLIYKLGE